MRTRNAIHLFTYKMDLNTQNSQHDVTWGILLRQKNSFARHGAYEEESF